MSITRIDVNADPTFWHSNVVVAGDYIYTSYQAGIFDDGGNVIGSVAGQTEQAIKNLQRNLARAGATLEDVVKVTLLVRSASEFEPAIMAYGRFFGEICPARTTIVTDFLDEDLRVQLDAIAFKPATAG